VLLGVLANLIVTRSQLGGDSPGLAGSSGNGSMVAECSRDSSGLGGGRHHRDAVDHSIEELVPLCPRLLTLGAPGNCLPSAALEVGDLSAAGFHQLVRLDAEHVVPCAGCRPHLGPLQQVGVDEHAQMRCVTKGRHVTVGL
jgi:hypothetical protein